MEYQLLNYLSNTMPKILTFGAYELYKRGYKPIEQKTHLKIIKKINSDIIRSKICKILKGIQKNSTSVKKQQFYKLLLDIFGESTLDNIFKVEDGDVILIITLEILSDPEYGNKFEYLRAKAKP